MRSIAANFQISFRQATSADALWLLFAESAAKKSWLWKSFAVFAGCPKYLRKPTFFVSLFVLAVDFMQHFSSNLS